MYTGDLQRFLGTDEIKKNLRNKDNVRNAVGNSDVLGDNTKEKLEIIMDNIF